MFKQTITYYFYPPFDPHIDKDQITILQRYVYAQPYLTSKGDYGITFNVEERCEAENNNDLVPFFRTLFTQNFELTDLPEQMHLSIIALAENQVFGKTAEIFVQGLFMDLCVTTARIKWMSRYFPKWTKLEDEKKNETLSELLNMQRRIRNGEFTK